MTAGTPQLGLHPTACSVTLETPQLVLHPAACSVTPGTPQLGLNPTITCSVTPVIPQLGLHSTTACSVTPVPPNLRSLGVGTQEPQSELCSTACTMTPVTFQLGISWPVTLHTRFRSSTATVTCRSYSEFNVKRREARAELRYKKLQKKFQQLQQTQTLKDRKIRKLERENRQLKKKLAAAQAKNVQKSMKNTYLKRLATAKSTLRLKRDFAAKKCKISFSKFKKP